jgi:hypothetical protein
MLFRYSMELRSETRVEILMNDGTLLLRLFMFYIRHGVHFPIYSSFFGNVMLLQFVHHSTI